MSIGVVSVEQPERVFLETCSLTPFTAAAILLEEQIVLKKSVPAHNAVHLTPLVTPGTAYGQWAVPIFCTGSVQNLQAPVDTVASFQRQTQTHFNSLENVTVQEGLLECLVETYRVRACSTKFLGIFVLVLSQRL